MDGNAAWAEWFIPEVSLEVRQGDFLLTRPDFEGKQEVCLVITADCDISKGKFGKQLACLRVVPLQEYLCTIWADKKLSRLTKAEIEKIRSQVAKWHTAKIGQTSRLTAEAVVAWIKRETPEVLAAQLDIPTNDCKKFVKAMSTFKEAFACLEDEEISDSLLRYIKYRAIALNKDTEICRTEVLADAQKDIENLPEDVFFLTSIPKISSDGAVVLLRQLVAVPHETVCYRVTDHNYKDAMLRVGRLHPTFKYAISQAFGSLYSKIGLPAEYESGRKTIATEFSIQEWVR